MYFFFFFCYETSEVQCNLEGKVYRFCRLLRSGLVAIPNVSDAMGGEFYFLTRLTFIRIPVTKFL